MMACTTLRFRQHASMHSPDDLAGGGPVTGLPSLTKDVAVVSDFPYTEPQAPPSLPLRASVLFLRIREFGALSAEEQARQRSSAIQLTGKLLRLWPDDGRVVLQAVDGTAIVGLDNPGLALDAAERAAGHPGLVLGLHHGPVETVELDEAPRLRGEGIASAHALAGLPQAQPLVATGEFRQALLAADPRRAESLRHAGDFVDAELRSREIYAIDAAVSSARRQRRMLVAGATVAGILGAGFIGGLARQGYEAGRRPAVIQLAIRPSAQIWVDGEFKGDSPPLTRLSMAPGRHTVELRNSGYKTVHLELQLKPGEELEVKHVFRRSPASLWDRLRFW